MKLNIVTSYYPKIDLLIKAGYTVISIAGKAPAFYEREYLEYKKLAPKYSFFSEWKDKKITNEDYVRLYKEQVLKGLGPQTILQELIFLANSCKFALLCYEKPGDFCHRHIVAKWFSQELNIKVLEWGTLW